MNQKSFNKAAPIYDSVAFLQRAVCEDLISRLEFFPSEKKTILDLGCGTGFGAKALAEKYPSAQVLALDLAFGMLVEAGRKTNATELVCADARALPFQADSVDLIFSNMTLQWCQDLPRVFEECLRVLTINGILLFSTTGPNTLKELQTSWLEADKNHQHVNSFMDMHPVGDLLIQAGFADPVLDVDHYVLEYGSAYELLKELKTLGSSKSGEKIFGGLTTRKMLAKLSAAYEHYRNDKKTLPATYEIIFGVAKKVPKKTSSSNEVFVPVSQIGRAV